VDREHPDDYLLDLWDREPRLLVGVITAQAADPGRRGLRLSPHEVLDYLSSAGARRFAQAVRPNLPKGGESAIEG
jgi:hypothetical protein